MSSGITTKITPPVHKMTSNERIVGEWVDGKPVYEKVISLPITTNDNSAHELTIMSLAGKTLIMCDGVVGPATNALKSNLPIPSAVSTNNYFCIASRGGQQET